MVRSMRGQDRLGPLENGLANDQDKRITIRPQLDELDMAEKKALKVRR